jgi:hypothetical protein
MAEPLPIPGTVQLIDTDGNVRRRHAAGSKNSDIILIPTPSADPQDPLNWSFRRKLVATSCVVMYVFAPSPLHLYMPAGGPNTALFI